jgi:hypothetical protein
MTIAQKIAGSALAAVFVAGIALSAQAATRWQEHHPRRAEVNHRLHRQDERIRWERHDGKLTPKEAMQLHHEDHHVRAEERVAARHDGGHITPGEQHAFNHQENQVGHQIRVDSGTGAGTVTGGSTTGTTH